MDFRVASHSTACSTVVVGQLGYATEKDFIDRFKAHWKGDHGGVYCDNDAEDYDLSDHSFFIASTTQNQTSAISALPKLGFTKVCDGIYNSKNGTSPSLFVASNDDIEKALKALEDKKKQLSDLKRSGDVSSSS